MSIKIFYTSKDTIKQLKGLPTKCEKVLANNISDKGLVAAVYIYIKHIYINIHVYKVYI